MSGGADFADVAAAYQRLFADRPDKGDGAVVLADLKGFCAGGDMFVPGKPDETANLVGRYRVWLRIERALVQQADRPAPPEDAGQPSLFEGLRGVEAAPGPLGVEGAG